MEMSSSRLIPAPREAVWAALKDPAILKDCIPGCERIDAISAAAYRIAMVVKIGSIRARFNGKMQLENLVPPASYTLVFEGEGGVAGFAKGRADVSLAPDGDGTRLTYFAKARIGGKLAQIGSRLLDSAASKTVDEFFTAFAERLASMHGPGIDDKASAVPPDSAAEPNLHGENNSAKN
ncbi:MAG: CoxG family protein [Noviherbaspirillum sp.]